MFLQISLILSSTSNRCSTDIKKLLILEKLTPIGQAKFFPTDKDNESRFEITAEGSQVNFERLSELLRKSMDVISIIGINVLDSLGSVSSTQKVQSVTDAKAECVKILVSFFGEGGADEIEGMPAEEAIKYSRGKVAGLIGENAAQAFDKITF